MIFGFENPQFLLQPWKSLKQFSEEMYAASSRIRDSVKEDGVKLKAPADKPALTIQRPEPKDDLIPTPATKRARPAPGSLAAKPDASIKIPDQPLPEKAPSLLVEGGAKFAGPEPARFDVAPELWDSKKRQYYTPAGWSEPDDGYSFKPPGGGGTDILIGKIASGSGQIYSVDLYSNGPDAAADDTGPVSVTITNLNAADTLPANTWLFGIARFTGESGDVYYATVPVWLE